jgi:hypothetical protein
LVLIDLSDELKVVVVTAGSGYYGSCGYNYRYCSDLAALCAVVKIGLISVCRVGEDLVRGVAFVIGVYSGCGNYYAPYRRAIFTCYLVVAGIAAGGCLVFLFTVEAMIAGCRYGYLLGCRAAFKLALVCGLACLAALCLYVVLRISYPAMGYLCGVYSVAWRTTR